jgi:Tfp pilus assembly protein PilX
MLSEPLSSRGSSLAAATLKNPSIVGRVSTRLVGLKPDLRLNRQAKPIPLRARQQGVTLFISLIVLIIMTLAGIQLMRSVDTSNIIAGNLSFQQAATHSGDSGIETAIGWLEQQNNTSASNLYNDLNTVGVGSCKGYTSNYTAATEPPLGGATWDNWWNALSICQTVTLPTDTAGNTASYTINRMCSTANLAPANSNSPPVQYCATSTITVAGGANNSQTSGALPLKHNGQIYYRITSRINGPRGTKSYVQAIVAL